jgi:nicotinamidase-related amidase
MLMRAQASQLVVVDLQERLLPAINGSEGVLRNVGRLLAAAGRLSVPVLVTEQYPRGLGPTVSDVARRLPEGARVLEKIAFSGAADPGIAAAAETLRGTGRTQMVICGTEAHVCVLQTALGFRERGYEVFVVADAVSSRSPHSVQAACARLLHAGCGWVTTEMVLFEWMAAAGTDDFRAISALIK